MAVGVALTLALSSIPRVIYQAYHSPEAVPDYVGFRWDVYAPGWDRHVLNDDDCVRILGKHFSENYTELFYDLREGAHKADPRR